MKIAEEIELVMEFKYQKLDEGGDYEDDESGEEGVGEKATKESEEEGSAHESAHFTRCSGQRKVHELRQICDQVACIR